MKQFQLVFVIVISLCLACTTNDAPVVKSEITKWPNDKKGAISITYDDGIINQLTVARPIMNRLGLPATFFIITGKVPGSAQGKFIGRPAEEIIGESETIPTNAENFFERASLIGHTGTTEAIEYHSRAGSLFESDRIEEAYALIDEGFEKLRNGTMKDTDDVVFHDNDIDTTTWEQYASYTAEGHEIASHTVTHARLAVLDKPNLLYELEQSKADIAKFLGEEFTFSVECPYGTEDERVMEYALELYPASRNRMPETYLAELNRASDASPADSDKEYVQWQRGPLINVPMDEMKSWVDICASQGNVWLALVFHGINGVGWEPRTDAELEEYFTYIKEQENNVWVATFGDVTKYIRSRKAAEISSSRNGDVIEVEVRSSLDPRVYDVPLTIKTYIPSDWNEVELQNDTAESTVLKVEEDDSGKYVRYSQLQGTQIVLKAGGGD